MAPATTSTAGTIAANRHLKGGPIVRSDIAPGGIFPDYELPDHENVPRRLSESSVEDLRRDLRAVTSEIRPDWDLSTPGLRDAWDAGNWAPFHGWNKRVRPD